MITGILYNYLLKLVLIALLALILFGVVSGTNLALILILFVGLRFVALSVEALREPVSSEQWEKMRGALTGNYDKLAPEKRATIAAALKCDPCLSARELAQSQVDRAIQNYAAPRTKRELSAEALGAIAFALLIPLDIALYARDFFSLRSGQGWEGAAVVAVCLGLYVWPHSWRRSDEISDFRIWWWALSFVIALLLLIHAINTRHPYLNPFNPDHDRLAAERVLALKNNIVAGQHADWVLRYARKLDERGETQQAIHLYREGLRLDANDREAAKRLATLEPPLSGSPEADVAIPSISPTTPYWTADKPVIESPRKRIDSQLENCDGCTVVIVPVGEVPDSLLDAVGYTIKHELDLPVYISPDTVPQPPHTRVRGLATGPQWDASSLVSAFTNATKVFPKAPIKYVLITSVDIYMEDDNYVFSTASPWGGVLSSARFGGQNGDDPRKSQRTAKQALSVVIQSFGVPRSTDRNCVTSYTRSLDEFDTKGNRPDADTLKLFRQAVSDMNKKWQSQQFHLLH